MFFQKSFYFVPNLSDFLLWNTKFWCFWWFISNKSQWSSVFFGPRCSSNHNLCCTEERTSHISRYGWMECFFMAFISEGFVRVHCFWTVSYVLSKDVCKWMLNIHSSLCTLTGGQLGSHLGSFLGETSETKHNGVLRVFLRFYLEQTRALWEQMHINTTASVTAQMNSCSSTRLFYYSAVALLSTFL